jgi:hypothetical protein
VLPVHWFHIAHYFLEGSLKQTLTRAYF